jgi:hypothetical protein
MNTQQSQRGGALVAGGAGLVLIASMFLEWYTLELPERIREREVDLPTFTAFEGLKRADVAVVVAAGVAIIVAGLVLTGILANSPAPGIAAVALSLFALAVVLYRGIISPPGLALFGVDFEMEVSFGWFVSLVAALVMVVGGVLTYLAGPRLQLEGGEADSSREEHSADGQRRPLS